MPHGAVGIGSGHRCAVPYGHRAASAGGVFAHQPSCARAMPVNIHMLVDSAHRLLPALLRFLTARNTVCASDLVVAVTNPRKYLPAGSHFYTKPAPSPIDRPGVTYPLYPTALLCGCASLPAMASPLPHTGRHRSA